MNCSQCRIYVTDHWIQLVVSLGLLCFVIFLQLFLTRLSAPCLLSFMYIFCFRVVALGRLTLLKMLLLLARHHLHIPLYFVKEPEHKGSSMGPF
jgi:hypothetical protein